MRDDVGRSSFNFDLPSERYAFVRLLGRGTYGTVCAYSDKKRNRYVAVKKIVNPLRNAINSRRCLREIRLLRLLNHDCIIPILHLYRPPGTDEIYVFTELMDADLHTVIANTQVLSDQHCQFFIYNMLRALVYLHAVNVVHRDLKPLNILVNKNCDIKLCDFGLATMVKGTQNLEDSFLRTEYVGTRWYRAPEVVLTSMEYTAAIDIWSTGCILCELLGRQPIFRGTDFLDQIRRICEIVGSPTNDELAWIPRENETAKTFVLTRFPKYTRKCWKRLFPDANDHALELIDAMLQFDPSRRIPAAEALRHKYLEDNFSEYDSETHVCGANLPAIDWQFDNQSESEIRRLVYEEVSYFEEECT